MSPTRSTANLQLAAVLALLQESFGEDLIGVYDHGSAVLGGMTPTSDLDVLAIIGRPMTLELRQRLVTALLSLSVPPKDEPTDGDKRPIELTVAVQGDVKPWRFPPVGDFQFGDWLRPDIERGVLPARALNPDLAVLLSIAWEADKSFIGPPLRDVLDPVPQTDVLAAMRDEIDELWRTLDAGTDDRNVLLTLARIWMTCETGAIARKDAAAAWAAERLDAADAAVLSRAQELYLAGRYTPWNGLEPRIHAAAAAIIAKVRAAPTG